MVFRECLEALIVCTGNEKIVQFHGSDNTVGEIKKYPTIMLEVIASQDLWIWHAVFEVAGANNDINVLDNSSLFDDFLDDKAHVAPYAVNGVEFEKGYYLADGIYPQWATFVKSFTVANDAKHACFKKCQEGARKDVEHAFDVLQGRWGIIQQPTRQYHVNTIRRIMYSCIIMHNMILKDQKMVVFDWNDVYDNPSRNMKRTWIESQGNILFTKVKNIIQWDHQVVIRACVLKFDLEELSRRNIYSQEDNGPPMLLQTLRYHQVELYIHKEEMAPIALSDSKYDDLLIKLDDTGFKAATYKRGLSILEGQVVKYKEHEVLFSEEIALLKRSVGHKDYQMGLLRTELEKVKLEKEGFEFKIAKFEKSAKDLDQLLASQITDKSKKGFGYNVVPSPHPLILNRPTPLDLSYSGLEEFKEPEVNEYGPRDSSLKPTTGCDKESDNSKENTDDSLKQQQKTDSKTSSVKSPLKVDKDWKEKFFCPANHVREEEPKKARENNDAPIIEEWVSDDEDVVETTVVVKKKTVIPTAAKIEKPVRKPVRYAEMYRSQRPRGNQRNWNGQKSNQLGSDFVMHNKACYICGSFDHLQYTCKHKRHVNDQKQVKPVWKNTRRVNDYYSTRMTHSNPRRNMIPQAVLMRSGIKAVNTAKPKDAHNVVKRNWFHDVKASACWVWRPKQKEILDNVSKHNSASMILKRLDYIDVQGRFKWMHRLRGGKSAAKKKKNPSNPMVHHGFLNKYNYIDDEISKTLMEVMLLLVEELYGGRHYGNKNSFLMALQEYTRSFESEYILLNKIKISDCINDASEKYQDDSSLKDNGTADQQVNTARPDFNTGSREPSVQTRRMTTSYSELGFLSAIYEGKSHQDLHTCLFACFLSQEETKKSFLKLSGPAWVECYEGGTFYSSKLQKVWILVDLPKGHIEQLLKKRLSGMSNLQVLKDPDILIKVYKVTTGIGYDTLANPIIFWTMVSKSYSRHDISLLVSWMSRTFGILRISLEFVAYTDSDYLLELHKIGTVNHWWVVLFREIDLLTKGFDAVRFSVLGLIRVLEDDLKKTKLTYSAAITKLILRVKKLEAKVKARTARKRARVVLSEDDEDDQGSSEEKGNSKVSAAGANKGTASEVPVVSTAEKRTRKDKGKAIMTEPEPKKKSKKELEQERLSFTKAIRLQEQMDEEQRAQIARDEEITRQWDEEEGQRDMSEVKSSKKIDWNDPSVIRHDALKMKPKTVAQARRNMVKYLKNQGNYKISDFKGMSYNEIRPIFEKVWDFNQHIEPMDLEHGSERMKSPKKIEEEDVDTQKEMKEVSKESGAKRKKSLPRKSTRSTVKRQKMELDDEKEDLKGYLDIVPREDVAEDVESLSTKYPIVDWKTCVLTENFMYYQIFRGDGSSKNYKVLSEMLEDFNRQDVMDLHRLVKERYSASGPEGYDLIAFGEICILYLSLMKKMKYGRISMNIM
ncbi:ALP1-like protein [Tanacetum coccineum]